MVVMTGAMHVILIRYARNRQAERFIVGVCRTGFYETCGMYEISHFCIANIETEHFYVK